MSRFFVDADISVAQTIDTSVYNSPLIFEEIKEKIFASCWQFAGTADSLPENGSCYPFTLLPHFLDEPLLMARDESGRIRCLTNVCTHRGNLLIDGPCKVSSLRCKYHGRLFHLDGRLKSMPEFKEVSNFPSPADDLQELQLFQWSQFLFTSVTPAFQPQEFFRDMIARVEWTPVAQFVFQPALTMEYFVDANWALYCENYLEGFHIPYVHAGLNALIDYSNYETELFFPFAVLQIGVGRSVEDCFELPQSSPDYGKNIAAYYFWVFPNLMFNFYPWGLSINLVEPLSVDRTKVTFLNFVWDGSGITRGAGGDLNKVEAEDEEIVKKVQRGVRSRFYNHGRYSVKKERGTHHFHRLLAQFLNS